MVTISGEDSVANLYSLIPLLILSGGRAGCVLL